MVRPGPKTKKGDVKEEMLAFLAEHPAGRGFGEIFKRMKNEVKSTATLVKYLRAYVRDGLVEWDVNTRKWRASPAVIINVQAERKIGPLTTEKMDIRFPWGQDAIDMVYSLNSVYDLKEKFGIPKEVAIAKIEKTSPMYRRAIKELIFQTISPLKSALSICQLRHALIQTKPSDEQIKKICGACSNMKEVIGETIETTIRSILERRKPYGPNPPLEPPSVRRLRRKMQRIKRTQQKRKGPSRRQPNPPRKSGAGA